MIEQCFPIFSKWCHISCCFPIFWLSVVLQDFPATIVTVLGSSLVNSLNTEGSIFFGPAGLCMFTFLKKYSLMSSRQWLFFISFQFCKLHFLCQPCFHRFLYCLQFLFSSYFLWNTDFKKLANFLFSSEKLLIFIFNILPLESVISRITLNSIILSTPLPLS